MSLNKPDIKNLSVKITTVKPEKRNIFADFIWIQKFSANVTLGQLRLKINDFNKPAIPILPGAAFRVPPGYDKINKIWIESDVEGYLDLIYFTGIEFYTDVNTQKL